MKGGRTRRNGSSSGKGSVSRHAHLGCHNASALEHYSKVASFGCRNIVLRKEKNQSYPAPQRKKIIIGSINNLSCKDESRLYRLVSQCKALKQSFTFIQETHMSGYDIVRFEDEEISKWSFIYSGFQNKAAAGVGIVLSPRAKLIEDKVWMEWRILATRLIVNGIKISAICGYSPTD